MKRVSVGAPWVVDQMLLPGLPMPCIAARLIISRAHSLPLAARQAPPQPPRPPAASMVLLEAHSLARTRISLAGIVHSFSAHSGDLGTPSSLPRMYSFHVSNPVVRSAIYSLS